MTDVCRDIYGVKVLEMGMNALLLTAPIMPITIRYQEESLSTSKNLSLEHICINNMPCHIFQSIFLNP